MLEMTVLEITVLWALLVLVVTIALRCPNVNSSISRVTHIMLRNNGIGGSIDSSSSQGGSESSPSVQTRRLIVAGGGGRGGGGLSNRMMQEGSDALEPLWTFLDLHCIGMASMACRSLNEVENFIPVLIQTLTHPNLSQA